MGRGAMQYEDAIRYVFDRCGRGGDPSGLGDADVFRAARSGDWAKVDQALATALARLQEDARAIDWSASDAGTGGIRPNFEHSLEDARDALSRGPADPVATRIAIARLVHALKAAILKASANVPYAYKGEPE